MSLFRTRLGALACMLCLTATSRLHADGTVPPTAGDAPASPKDTVKPGRFIRVQRDKGEPTALQTAVVRYVPADGTPGVSVDLIGAVHVGDKSYYQQLNKQFERYDAVLYELVAPPGTRVPKGGRRDNNNPFGMLHTMMKTLLDLDSQLEQVDYTAENFVHADLSFEQMGEAMRKRGETGLTVFLGIVTDMLRQQALAGQNATPGKDDDVDVLTLLLDPTGPAKLKRLMAQQFENLENGGGLGATLTTILVSDRNQAAVNVLKNVRAAGKKKIAIFYGAAHMPDFEKRLTSELGLKRESTRWLTAWDLKQKAAGGVLDWLKMLDQ